MKKIILVVLMVVMVATPCFAQEIEPEGIFSLHGTKWQELPIGLQIFPPGRYPTDEERYGFYRGTVYLTEFNYPGDISFYIDLLVCSVFIFRPHYGIGGGWRDTRFGILQPGGIGIMLTYWGQPQMLISLLIKTDNNWKPPEFVSISPNQGEQGIILTDVTIKGVNTYFESGVDAIMFYPTGYGTAISNIRTISNTEIQFDLEIATDAPIGFRVVRVKWDNGKESVTGYDAFEVLPKTN
jgi:hypothetical protein